ncbi:MAG: CehA/McbA family metallohydrolase [Rubellimicrobium sp.]|nr:CehA/McbA family metallohydrolase [Rubellimicrobium sp.]
MSVPPGLPARITGRLGLDDMARHVPVPFRVPPGCAGLRIAFEHAPHHPGAGDIPHQLSISVIGPDGSRGTRHNNADQSVLLSETSASPGYLPGPIEPGLWRVEIDTHRILPPGGIDWEITVEAVAAPDAVPEAPPPAFVPRTGPLWVRGDLHRHTFHSDGLWSPAAMVADARARGYDFAALTDHNTTSALREAQTAAGQDLLILPGMELTTFHGHALALGSGALWDWRIRDGQTMSERAAAIMAAGDLYVIAHPMSAGHPFCTGCFWAWSDMLPGPARLVEVWNGTWGPGPKNPLGLDLFHGWLNAGHRLVATAGSDDHGRGSPEALPGHMLVSVAVLSVPGLLTALGRGHAVLTSGPRFTLTAQAHGRDLLPGDCAPGPVPLTLDWSDAAPAGRLRLITGRRGEEGVRVAHEATVGPAGQVTLDPALLKGADWAMVELRDAQGGMQALANPVFLGAGWEG